MSPRMIATYSDDVFERPAPQARRFIDENFVIPTNEDREPSVTDLLANSQLRLAVYKFGWDVILEQMQEPGAQLSFKNENNDTIIHQAFICQFGQEYVNAMLASYLRHSTDNLVNNDGLSYFHIACAKSSLEHVREFLSRSDVDVNSQIPNDTDLSNAGYSALHLAVDYNRIEIAAYLLDNNASIFVQDKNGTTPLHVAGNDRNTEMIDLLLTYDRTYANPIDNFSMSHFIAACLGSNSHIVEQYLSVTSDRYKISPKTLVSEKCHVSVYEGFTPLHFAARFGCLQTIKILLNCGASCCALDAENKTPVDVACGNSMKNFLKYLMQHCRCDQVQKPDEDTQLVQKQVTP